MTYTDRKGNLVEERAPVTAASVSNRAGTWRQMRWEYEVPGLPAGWRGLWAHFRALSRGEDAPLVTHRAVMSAWTTGARSLKVEAIIVVDAGVKP